MQIGVVYPQIELGGGPTAVRRIGRAVEDLGFDHLLAYDHVLGVGVGWNYVEYEALGQDFHTRGAARHAGGTHLSVVTMGLGLGSVDGHIDHLAAIAGELSLS
jgi:hypothetical protein